METFKKESAVGNFNGIGAMVPVMELLISIGIFAVISIFLIRFFVTSNRISEDASALSKASILSETAMELIKGKSVKEVPGILDGKMSSEKDGVFTVRYDSDFKTVADGGTYLMEITETSEKTASGSLRNYFVVFKRIKDGTEIFTLNGKSYEKSGE